VDGDGIPELMVGTIGDGRANPNAGAVHLLYLGLNTTGDLLPSVKDWRKITTGAYMPGLWKDVCVSAM
jgi:hypothetical protein